MPTIDDFLLKRSAEIPLGATEEKRSDLVLTQLAVQTGTVRGTVTNSVDGSHVANATVKLRTQTGDPVAHTLTNPGGNYVLEDVAPGTYTINAALQGFATSNGQTFTIQSGQNLNIDIAITPDTRSFNVVYGTVTNQATGAPVASANVALIPAIGVSENVMVAKTDALGQYQLCNVPDMTASLIVAAAGFYLSSFVSVTISGGSIIRTDVSLTPFTLPQATVNGFITQQNGTPVANACVGLYLVDQQGVEILQQVTFTDSRGFYIFGRVAAGTYVVKAKSEKTVALQTGKAVNL
ncbi:MAG TPA: carboxypeptidase-like regulatory domain-containing protein [Bacillota bacterium]|nr:carboxypeptidase-like regulatory domain-containing protein [Bacillota bacterium]